VDIVYQLLDSCSGLAGGGASHSTLSSSIECEEQVPLPTG
jgi:hypothetical protein